MYNVDKIEDKEYYVDMDIVIDNKIIPVPSFDIASITVNSDYINQILPVLSITFGVSDYIREEIIINKEKVKFRLEMRMDGTGNYEKIIFNKYFIPVLDEEQLNPNKARNVNGKSDEEDSRFISFTVYLFEEESFKAVKKTYNNIYKDTNISHIPLHILSSLNLPFIISPFDRDEIMSEVVLPNLNLKNTITYLQRVFGLYESGLRIFMDLNRSYLLSKSISNIPVELSETEDWNIFILGDPATTVVNSGQYFDKEVKKFIYIGQQLNMDIKNNMVVDKYLEGEEIDVINIDKFDGKVEVNNTVSVRDNTDNDTRIKTFYDPYKNEYNKNEALLDRYSRETILTLAVKNISILDFTPNKRYTFNFEKELTKFNNTYRLDRLNYSLSKSINSATFKLEGYAIFSKGK